MIILIIILIMIVLIILLIFFIYYVLDSCLRIADKRNIKCKKLKNQRVLKKKTVEDNDVSDSTDESYYCSDDSYIYGKNLSIGNSKMNIWREHKLECFFGYLIADLLSSLRKIKFYSIQILSLFSEIAAGLSLIDTL